MAWSLVGRRLDKAAGPEELGGPAVTSMTLPAGSWSELSKWGKILGKRAGSGKGQGP